MGTAFIASAHEADRNHLGREYERPGTPPLLRKIRGEIITLSSR